VLCKGQALLVPSDPLLTRLATAWCGRASAGVVEFNLEGLVGGLEGQDGSDAGEIEAVIEEPADLPEADQVVVAVSAGATLAAGRCDQAPGLVEPEVLGSAAHQIGRYRDAVEAATRIGTVILPRRSALGNLGKTTCIGHGLQGITNL